MNKHLEIEVPRRIFVYSQPIAMHKSFKGLSELVTTEMRKNPLSGDMFLFLNKRGDYIKILAACKSGMILLCKKLREGAFEGISNRSCLSLDELQRVINFALDRKSSSQTLLSGI